MFKLRTNARPAVVFGSVFIPRHARPVWDFLTSTVGVVISPGNGTEVPCVRAVKPPKGRVRSLHRGTGANPRRTGGGGAPLTAKRDPYPRPSDLPSDRDAASAPRAVGDHRTHWPPARCHVEPSA